MVEKIKEKRKPDNFFGKPQPGTEGDNPEVGADAHSSVQAHSFRYSVTVFLTSPSPATIKKNTHKKWVFFYAVAERLVCD